MKLYLKYISAGKYSQGLFHKGSSSYSTAFGGVLTMLFALFIMICTFISLENVYDRQMNIRILEERSFPFNELEASSYTLEELQGVLDYQFYVIVAKRSYQTCDQVQMSVMYTNKTFDMDLGTYGFKNATGSNSNKFWCQFLPN